MYIYIYIYLSLSLLFLLVLWGGVSRAESTPISQGIHPLPLRPVLRLIDHSQIRIRIRASKFRIPNASCLEGFEGNLG